MLYREYRVNRKEFAESKLKKAPTLIVKYSYNID